tara:strand:+ start:335 stop:925 length:591 start_codon:yes stop_codon:yes gene_type:complete
MIFPVFPLNGAILFPNTNLPLNIFEERYIEMVDYAFSNNRLIGMVQIKENKDFFKIGCLGKITSFTETPDKRYQINLEGINRFRIKKIIKNSLKFVMVEGEEVESYNLKKNLPDLNKKLLLSFKKYLDIKKVNFDTSEFDSLDSLSLAKIICVISPLDYLTKQMLLEFGETADLCNNLLSVLEIEINNIENNFKVN